MSSLKLYFPDSTEVKKLVFTDFRWDEI